MPSVAEAAALFPTADLLVRRPGTVRIATFNAALAGEHEGEIFERLKRGDDAQAKAVASIIQRVNPDVLLINELDFDPTGELLNLFVERYLAVPQQAPAAGGPGSPAVQFACRFAAAVNTGVASGFDLDRDDEVGSQPGSSSYARDAWGFGRYPGQYGMVLLSKFPIDRDKVRTFQHFLWKDMPGALLPTRGSDTWYSEETLAKFPLSSKSHWDVPIVLDGKVLHVLASHPTPPVFDGPEDRNGRRNHDEIRFWADYLGGDKSQYIVDDGGLRGGLADDASCVILGDLNSDPVDGSDDRYPIQQLLTHSRLSANFVPRSPGGREQADSQGGANLAHHGEAAADTGDFADEKGPGNLRLDYVLPSRDLRVVGGGVYWPDAADPQFALVGSGHPVVSSDHRMVWIDVDSQGSGKESE